MAEIAESHGATPAQVALAWVLRHPNVIVIPGASSTRQLEENAAAAALVLSAEQIEGAAAEFSPSNFHYGLVPPLEARIKGGRKARREAMFARALADLEAWLPT